MDNVLTFPGIERASLRPRPTRVADLPDGAKALVVVADDAGYAVVMRPALTEDERMVRPSFATAEEALSFARRMSATYPLRYQLVLRETGRRSLDELIGVSQWRGARS